MRVTAIGIMVMTVFSVMGMATVSKRCNVNVRSKVVIGKPVTLCMRMGECRHLPNDKSHHHCNRHASVQHRFLCPLV
jgi:hypothetical protein